MHSQYNLAEAYLAPPSIPPSPFLDTNKPSQIANPQGMHLLAAEHLPPLRLRVQLLQHVRDLPDGAGAHARDVAVEDEDGGDDGEEVGEEQVEGGAPEEDGGDEEEEEADEEAHEEGGGGAVLELEDAGGLQAGVSLRVGNWGGGGGEKGADPNPSDVLNVSATICEASLSSK